MLTFWDHQNCLNLDKSVNYVLSNQLNLPVLSKYTRIQNVDPVTIKIIYKLRNNLNIKKYFNFQEGCDTIEEKDVVKEIDAEVMKQTIPQNLNDIQLKDVS